MFHVVLLNSSAGEDYLADLFISALITCPNVCIYTNYIPQYLFDDYLEPESLYGRGYTAFCSVPAMIRASDRVRVIPASGIQRFISCQHRIGFYVCFTSIWRYSEEFHCYSGVDRPSNIKNLLVLDGEDEQAIHQYAAHADMYYKRELASAGPNLFPISFRIPASSLPLLTLGKRYVPQKTTLLAPCDPRYRPSYVFRNQADYYRQYQSAFFAATTKKGGWDCLRHYEILANHCLPYFPDISCKPTLTMSDYPIRLQMQANKLFESAVLSPRPLGANFRDEYTILLHSFLDYFYSSCLSHAYRNILTSS